MPLLYVNPSRLVLCCLSYAFYPGVSHVPSSNCFTLFPVIICRTSLCVPSILFAIDYKRTTFLTHTIKSLAPPPCRNFPTPWDLPPPVKVVSLASLRPTLRAWWFATQPANHDPFGLGAVPYIGRSVHSPLSRIPLPHVGWTPFHHISLPYPHPSTGAVSPLT